MRLLRFALNDIASTNFRTIPIFCLTFEADVYILSHNK